MPEEDHRSRSRDADYGKWRMFAIRMIQSSISVFSDQSSETASLMLVPHAGGLR